MDLKTKLDVFETSLKLHKALQDDPNSLLKLAGDADYTAKMTDFSKILIVVCPNALDFLRLLESISTLPATKQARAIRHKLYAALGEDVEKFYIETLDKEERLNR
jgi:hypothetical protein